MTLKELFDLKVIYENVKIVDLDTKTKIEALRVFNRPTVVEDFKVDLSEQLPKEVKAIYGSTYKHKLIIEVSK